MATQIGGIILGEAGDLLRSGSRTSEFRLAAIVIAALCWAAWYRPEIAWYWPMSVALVTAAYCLSRGATKAGAGEAIAAAQPVAGTAPTLASAGKTLPIVAMAAFILASCVPAEVPNRQPMRDPAAVLAQSCEAYADALEALAGMNAAGELSTETVQRVDAIRWQVGPVCEDQPADPEPYLLAVSQSVSELLAIQLQKGLE